MNLFDQIDAARTWSPEEQEVINQVKRLADEVIAPNAPGVDRSGEFPWANVEAINRLGLNGLFIPEVYGGVPMRFKLYLEVVSLITEACASTGIIYATNYHGSKPLIDFGTDEQRARLLPTIAEGGLASLAITESAAGSDATRMTTSFAPSSGVIVVNGAKSFITSADVADRILLFGKWSEIEDKRGAISALIVEKNTPGFEVISREEKLGHNASSTCTIAFDDMRVPMSNLLGQPGDGLEILLASLNKSRPSVAAHARGIARAAFKDMVSYGNERIQSGKRVLEFQGNQFMLADLASELALVERFIDYVADLVDGGATNFGLEASLAKLRASDLAMKMAVECVQFHGGYGYCKDYRAERLLRDAKITQIWEGTNQIHRQLIGRSFLQK